MNKFVRIIKNPYRTFSYLATRGHFKWMSDKTYLKLMFRSQMGKKLDLKNPKTFNEKLQWLKLYDRKPEYTKMVDKYEVKKYVAGIIGEEYIIPTLGVWGSFDDIDFDMLPDQFVLKCTHDSGGLVICKDKARFDKAVAKEKIERCLNKNYFYLHREWPYKDVKPRIIAEQYMEDAETQELRDYKFYCFDGEVKMLLVATDRQKKNSVTKLDFFDMDYNHLPFSWGRPNAETIPQKPKGIDVMVELSKKISANMTHIRVDFYSVNGNVYFGEITFYPDSGFGKFDPEEWNYRMGSWLKVPSNLKKGEK